MLDEAAVLNSVLTDAQERLKTLRTTFDPYDDLIWHSFPETWGSTSLGFGGMGAQMITTAQTHVVIDAVSGTGVVYWAGRYGKTVWRRRAQEIAAARSSR